MSDSSKRSQPMPLIALFLAWLVPGAGHLYLGRVRRAIIVFVTISALFWGGVFIGGILTVDSVYERWWFIAEMFTGIHGVVSWYRQDQLYEQIVQDVWQDRRERIAEAGGGQAPAVVDFQAHRFEVDAALAERGVALVSPQDTVARAYAGVAGMLNLMCIFDALVLALMGVRGEPTGGRKEPHPEEA